MLDADHINLDTVERFLAPSDFFTIDVAHFISKPAADCRSGCVCGATSGIDRSSRGNAGIHPEDRRNVSAAVQRSRADSYRHIESRKGRATSSPKSRWMKRTIRRRLRELLVILAAIADERIPIRRPLLRKFTGRFNKGVDYCDDIAQFTTRIRERSRSNRGRPYVNTACRTILKLSVHSGSDKFSIYAPIRKAPGKRSMPGLHLKTAGTTWLEELIGLSRSGRPRSGARQRNLRGGLVT